MYSFVRSFRVFMLEPRRLLALPISQTHTFSAQPSFSLFPWLVLLFWFRMFLQDAVSSGLLQLPSAWPKPLPGATPLQRRQSELRLANMQKVEQEELRLLRSTLLMFQERASTIA